MAIREVVFVAVFLSFFSVFSCKGPKFPPSVAWPNKKYISISRETKLECDTNGSNIVWMKGNEVTKLPNDKVVKVDADQGSGFYRCVVKNELGEAYSDFSQVIIHNWHPQSEKEEFGEAPTGGVGHLRCIDADNPNARKFYWEKINTVDQTGKKVESSLTNYIDKSGTLYFTYATKEDEGNYKCSVIYSVATETVTTNGNFRITDKIVENDFKLFKSSEETILGLIGQKATFECHFIGAKSYNVIWTINGKTFVDEQISNAKAETILVIENVKKEHEGDIKCVGKTSDGKMDEKTIKFEVKSQPRLPKGKKLLTEKYGEIGSNIEFMCDAPSDPKGKIQWYKNGIEIDPDNLEKNMGFSNGKKILRINNLKKINTAVYQCNVSNIYGYVYDNAFLKVFDTTKFTQKPEDLEEDSNNATFVCKGETDDETELTYKWLYNDKEFNDGKLDVKKEKLVIDVPYFKNIGKNVYGKWTCQITNGYFTKNADAYLKERIVQAFPNWWILLLVLLILLLLLIILACLCNTLYKNRSSDYPVDEIEHKNGNDPEKELLEIGFHDYQRDVGISNSGTMRSQRSMGSTNSLPRA